MVCERRPKWARAYQTLTFGAGPAPAGQQQAQPGRRRPWAEEGEEKEEEGEEERWLRGVRPLRRPRKNEKLTASALGRPPPLSWRSIRHATAWLSTFWMVGNQRKHACMSGAMARGHSPQRVVQTINSHLRAFPPLRAFRKAQGLQAPQHLGGGLAGQMLELMRQAIKRFFLRRRSCASRGIQRVHDEAKGALRRVWCTRAATHGNGGAAGGRASGCADTSAGRDVDVGWDADTARSSPLSGTMPEKARGAREVAPDSPPKLGPAGLGWAAPGPSRDVLFPLPTIDDAPAYSPAALGCTPRSPRSALVAAALRARGR